jgi:hypothetical protein
LQKEHASAKFIELNQLHVMSTSLQKCYKFSSMATASSQKKQSIKAMARPWGTKKKNTGKKGHSAQP